MTDHLSVLTLMRSTWPAPQCSRPLAHSPRRVPDKPLWPLPSTRSFYAVVAGVGGSTLSELLISAPVAWVHDPADIIVCLLVALLTWITPLVWWPPCVIDWFEALGIAAYGVVGSAKALSFGVPPVSAAIMGVVTACLGGVIRDVFAGEPSIVVKPDVYVTAAAFAAGAYVALVTSGLAPAEAAATAFMLGFGLRGLAIVRNIALPAYQG